MAEAGRKLSLDTSGRVWTWVWVGVAGLAIFELVMHAWIRAAIPSDESWEAASAFVRAHYEPGDQIVSVPSWTDPIVRHHLGDLQPLHAAAPSDLARFRRVWALGLHDATTRDEPPALEKQFEKVHVRLWPVSSDELVYDFVENVEQAQVDLVTGDGPRACPWRAERPSRGGLGYGPMTPDERFVCDPRRPWLWVGATVLQDLDLQPRRCVWQHPAGADPVRVTFADAPLGERLVVHAGIDYNAERKREHGPVTLRVFVEGELLGELVHRDGDGWSGAEFDTSALDLARGEVRFETIAEDPSARLFCWSASARRK